MTRHKNETSKQRRDRMNRWRHTSLLGQTRRAQTLMKSVLDAPTTTDAAQENAHHIQGQLDILYNQLKEMR